MNKVIEADFFPRNSDELSPPFSIGVSEVTGKRRILIVDNDRDTTHLVKILLERAGNYLVLEENDATKAHQSARSFGPDLILLDVVMPETDGGEVAARIEADSAAARADSACKTTSAEAAAMKTTTESSPMETTPTTMEASASTEATTTAAVTGRPCYGTECDGGDAGYQRN